MSTLHSQFDKIFFSILYIIQADTNWYNDIILQWQFLPICKSFLLPILFVFCFADSLGSRILWVVFQSVGSLCRFFMMSSISFPVFSNVSISLLNISVFHFVSLISLYCCTFINHIYVLLGFLCLPTLSANYISVPSPEVVFLHLAFLFLL